MLCGFRHPNERDPGLFAQLEDPSRLWRGFAAGAGAGVIPLAFETEVLPRRVELAGSVEIDYTKGREKSC